MISRAVCAASLAAGLALCGTALSAVGASEAAETSSFAASIPESGVIHFNVLRKGNEFGTHKLTFEGDASDLTVTTDVDLKAAFGPSTVFRYTLDVEERWADGKLQSVSGELNDDGTKGSVEARREGDRISVDGSAFSGMAPGDIVTSSWWNQELLNDAQVLSTEDGALTDIKVTNKGTETISTAFGEIEATRYLVESNITLDLWYDADGHWVKCAFEARGQNIEYVLAEPIS